VIKSVFSQSRTIVGTLAIGAADNSLAPRPVQMAFESPDQLDVIQLIDELDAYQKPLYPEASHHGIDIDALMQPNVVFAVVRTPKGHAIGCGAAVIEPGYGELKRMYIRPGHRRNGIAWALLAFLEAEAIARGCTLLTLETGVHQHAAIGLYARAGYVRCDPFGGYTRDPHSLFMQKTARKSG